MFRPSVNDSIREAMILIRQRSGYDTDGIAKTVGMKRSTWLLRMRQPDTLRLSEIRRINIVGKRYDINFLETIGGSKC